MSVLDPYITNFPAEDRAGPSTSPSSIFANLENSPSQKFDLENLQSAFCAFGKVSAVQTSHLVKFRVCRTFDLGSKFAKIELGEVPGPARSSAGGLATGRGLTFGPSAGELATGRGLTFGPSAGCCRSSVEPDLPLPVFFLNQPTA